MKELTYTKYGDYYLPNLTYPTTKPTYGKYGEMYADYLKQHNPGLMLCGNMCAETACCQPDAPF